VQRWKALWEIYTVLHKLLQCGSLPQGAVLQELLSLAAVVQGFFSPLLKYVITEALPPSLMGSALASREPLVKLASFGSIGHRGSFQQRLTEATPVAHLLPKPCHANPMHTGGILI